MMPKNTRMTRKKDLIPFATDEVDVDRPLRSLLLSALFSSLVSSLVSANEPNAEKVPRVLCIVCQNS